MHVKRRLGIFLFYDPQGKVDSYVLFLLRAMRKELSSLFVVVNGTVDEAGEADLRALSDGLQVRENIGFDVEAWKQGILSYCGKEAVRGYDALVLFNDSFFGPFYPFSDIFSEMEERELDFWGLTAHGEVEGSGLCPYGYRPRYIQTYFMVFSESVLQSDAFFDFWERQPIYKDYKALAECFVAVLTRHFADLGFRWGVYSDTSETESDRRKNFDPHSFRLYDLIAKKKYPVLKRRSFQISKDRYLVYQNTLDLPRSLAYIQKHYSYDLRMVFEHLLRKTNIRQIKEVMNLDFVLPEMPQAGAYVPRKTAVIAHLVYEALFPYCQHYLDQVPEETDLILTTNEEGKRERLLARFMPRYGARLRVLLVPNRGRDLSALLVGCADIFLRYEYVCFVHDKKSTQKEFPTVGEAFSDLLWENLLGSEAVIRNAWKVLENFPWVGLLTPSGVYYGSYFQSSVDYWTVCYKETQKLVERLGIRVPMSKEEPPLTVGTCFWCKTEALAPLFRYGFTYEDFPEEPLPNDGSISHAMERIFPYVAQAQGFCTGWVYTEEYARGDLSNFRYLFEQTTKTLRAAKGIRFANAHVFLQTVRAFVRRSGKPFGWARAGLFDAKEALYPYLPRWAVRCYRRFRK